jgi:hypothetical protein
MHSKQNSCEQAGRIVRSSIGCRQMLQLSSVLLVLASTLEDDGGDGESSFIRF